MSWVEKVKNEYIITTGNGDVYKPNWINPSNSVEYNIAEFNYPLVKGSKVDRGMPKGTRFNFEIVFQGEDHLEQSDAFRASADDTRPWTISHPLYGERIVQPLGLAFDNISYNVSMIKGTLIETITDDNPKITIDPVDKITNDKANLDEVFAQSFSIDIPSPDTVDIRTLTTTTLSLYNVGKGIINNTLDSEAYFNLFNDANAKILNATADPLSAMRSVQAMINQPALFVGTVKSRINSLTDQFEKLRESIDTITGKSDKRIYEGNAGGVIGTMTLAAVTNQDYKSGNEVLAVMDQIFENYNNFLSDLDALQTDNGGSPESYIPDPSTISGLSSLINFTISNLLNIALDSKKEISILVEDDTNVILLAHRFYGLEVDDSTIDKIISNNELGLNDLLQIRKGTKIIYYV